MRYILYIGPSDRAGSLYSGARRGVGQFGTGSPKVSGVDVDPRSEAFPGPATGTPLHSKSLPAVLDATSCDSRWFERAKPSPTTP